MRRAGKLGKIAATGEDATSKEELRGAMEGKAKAREARGQGQGQEGGAASDEGIARSRDGRGIQAGQFRGGREGTGAGSQEKEGGQAEGGDRDAQEV